MGLKIFSMFSGIGGFEYGIQKSKLDAEFIGHCEIDKYAESIYQNHYNNKNYGDATQIDTDELPNFDMLTGGFPCQSFSISGNRKGFDDTRGTMFFEIIRILKDKKPRYFLLENVRNILSHNNGETLKRILTILADLGYIVEWDLLNSQNFGLPQRRERVFFRGYFRGRTSIEEILHFRKSAAETMELNKNSCHQLNNDKKRYQDGRIYSKDGLSICINSRGNNGWYIIDDTKKCPCTQDNMFFAVTTRPRGMPFRKKQDNYVVYKDLSTRRLTPLECERLQGFPDSWTEYGVDGEIISDTQRYKCIGNAVSTNVITWIVNNMFM